VAVLIVIVLMSVGAVVLLTQSKKDQDHTAQQLLMKAVTALNRYKGQHGSFKGVTAGQLRKIDDGLPANLQNPIVISGGYSLALTSKTGVLYRFTRDQSGAVTRTCVVPANGEKGDCKANKFGVGSW